MRCPSCNARLANKHNFCYNCGANLYPDEVYDEENEPLTDEDMAALTYKPGKNAYHADEEGVTTPELLPAADDAPDNIQQAAKQESYEILTNIALQAMADARVAEKQTDQVQPSVDESPLYVMDDEPEAEDDVIIAPAITAVEPILIPAAAETAPNAAPSYIPKVKAGGQPVVLNPLNRAPQPKTAPTGEDALAATRQIPIINDNQPLDASATRQMPAIQVSMTTETQDRALMLEDDEIFDDDDAEYADVDVPRSRKRDRKDDEWDDYDEDYDGYEDDAAPVSPTRKILQIGLLVLVIGVVVFVGIYTVRNLPYIVAYLGNTTPSSSPGEMAADDPALRDPEISVITMPDGSTGHRMVFYGKEGDKIKIPNISQFFPVIDGQAEVDIPDSKWLEQAEQKGISNTTIKVTIPAILYRNEKEWLSISVEYEVSNPTSTLNILEPSENPFTTRDRQVEIRLQVSPGAQVKVGDSEYTSMVSAEGIVLVKLELNTGVNTIPIWTQLHNNAPATQELVVTRPDTDATLSITALPETTEAATVVIRGHAEPDAEVTTDATIEGSITRDAATGDFEFTVALANYGKNIIKVMALSAEKGEANETITVERIPNIEEYSKKAWKMDYPYLSTSTSQLIGKIFKCEGKVVETLESKDPDLQLFTFNVGGSTDQLVVIECKASISIEVGQRYAIFADVVGTHEKLPKLVGRFVNKA